ncbi:Bax inhibitor-1/YccA family membrane protein [Yinghuangia aomiensis]
MSHAFESMYSGIVVQAVLGTGGVFLGMLWAYKSGRVRVTARATRIWFVIAIGFLTVALVDAIVVLAGGGHGIGIDQGPIGIVFALVGLGLGAFFLALDFHEAEQLVAAGVPERVVVALRVRPGAGAGVDLHLPAAPAGHPARLACGPEFPPT